MNDYSKEMAVYSSLRFKDDTLSLTEEIVMVGFAFMSSRTLFGVVDVATLFNVLGLGITGVIIGTAITTPSPFCVLNFLLGLPSTTVTFEGVTMMLEADMD